MFLGKKLLLPLGLLLTFTLVGTGTQSNSLAMQFIGFFGLLIGLVILYLFGRMVWRALGCLTAFFILALVAVFMMYALGFFNHGVGGIGTSIRQFIGYNASEENADESQTHQAPQKQIEEERSEPIQADISEDFSDMMPEEDFSSKQETEENISPQLFGDTTKETSAQTQRKSQEPNMLQRMSEAVRSKTEPKADEQENIPMIYGTVRVITADTLEMYGKKIRLFGIDAPEVSQTCADKYGRSYRCGYEALAWLKSWITEDAELECRVFKQDTQGNVLAACAYGPYDLGAALVNAGWALAYTKQSEMYIPYEIQAQAARRGLWQGKFYKPWDWRKLQSRKAKIKVLKPKKRLQGIFG
jgi:endonuclease YncB( thermonuclease family)